MENTLLVSYRKMDDKTLISVQTNSLYVPSKGEIIDFRDFPNNLKDFELKKEWQVQKVVFQLPYIVYVDVFNNNENI